jgi:E3 ubiquitin-protein ligase CCNP1IP1
MLVDQDNLRRKNEELAQAFRDKSRKHSQTQELYDKLKRRVMLGQVQNAASDAVNHTINASTVSNNFIDPTTGFDQRPRQSPPFIEPQGNMMHQSSSTNDSGNLTSMPPPVAKCAMNEGWNGSSGQGNHQR